MEKIFKDFSLIVKVHFWKDSCKVLPYYFNSRRTWIFRLSRFSHFNSSFVILLQRQTTPKMLFHRYAIFVEFHPVNVPDGTVIFHGWLWISLFAFEWNSKVVDESPRDLNFDWHNVVHSAKNCKFMFSADFKTYNVFSPKHWDV